MSNVREVQLPDGLSMQIVDDGKKKTLHVEAGGYGTCPGCKYRIRLGDPSAEIPNSGSCPICKSEFFIFKVV